MFLVVCFVKADTQRKRLGGGGGIETRKPTTKAKYLFKS